MATNANPLGPTVTSPPASPPTNDITLTGRYVTIGPISASHAADLFEATTGAANAGLFDYLFDDQPSSVAELQSILTQKATTTNPWTYAILSDGKAVGSAALMRMDLPNRTIEVGSILYTPSLQRTPAATEAMYLLARYVFDTLGFRRYEWKCNDLNAPSKRAATRLGFVYEGLFRQHMIVRGLNRDTAWFSIVDGEWPVVRKGLEEWLLPGNFDEQGRQRRTLEECRAGAGEEM
ncbi:hypothetical protein ANO11243_054900 [Dothideomycetidae sp. 11243]|nr:hypothetical protein ANO11243_054900 [fungal sp. No.11243]